MGENYLTLRHLLTQVLIIVPGLLLGVRASWNIFKPEEQPAPHKLYKYAVLMYLVLGVLELGYIVYWYLPKGSYQNTPVDWPSKRLASHWWIYYYAVLVLTPSQVLSVIYYFTAKEALSLTTSEVVKSEQAQLNQR